MVFDHETASPSDLRHAVRDALLQESIDEQHILSLVKRQPDAFGSKFLFPVEAAAGKKKSHKKVTIFPLSRLLCLCPSVSVVRAVYEAYSSAISSKDEFKRTPLHYACRHGASLEVISFLLECNGAAISEATKYGMLPIHYAAAYHPDLSVLEKLIDLYPEGTKVKGGEQRSLPIHFAGLRDSNRLDKIRLLLEYYPESIRKRNGYGFLPLHLACRGTPSIETLQHLVDHYPQAIGARTNRKEYPLHVACHMHASIDTIKFLIQVFPVAAVSQQNRSKTPLGVAIEQAAPPVVVDFLRSFEWYVYWKWDWEEFVAATPEERKTLLDEMDADSCSELQVATEQNDSERNFFDHKSAKQSDLRCQFRKELCEPELDKGEILQLVKKAPKICTYVYSFPPHSESSPASSSTEELKLYPLSQICHRRTSLDLVQAIYIANPDAVSHQDVDLKRSPLHFACAYASAEIVHFLLSTYSDAARLANADGLLPLHYACMSGQNLGIVQSLVAFFPESVKHTTRHFRLPLHDACLADSCPGLIDFLLSCYPEAASHRTNKWAIPLHIACGNGRSLSEVKALVNAFPKGVRAWDRQSGIPLQWACSGDNPNVDVVQYLLEMYPQGVNSKTNRKLTARDMVKESDESSSSRVVTLLLEKVTENLSDLEAMDCEERRKQLDAWRREWSVDKATTYYSTEGIGVAFQQSSPHESVPRNNSTEPMVDDAQEPNEKSNKSQPDVSAAASSMEALLVDPPFPAQPEVFSETRPGAFPVQGPAARSSNESDSSFSSQEAAEPSSSLQPQPSVATVTPVAAELAPNVLEMEAELQDYRNRFASKVVVEASEIVVPVQPKASCCILL